MGYEARAHTTPQDRRRTQGPSAATESTYETAVLVGGPADGTRIRVAGRPSVVQVTYPCELDGPAGGARADALFVYRRDPRVENEPLRYGADPASP
ncbi:hypothetical protein ACFY9Q_06680 [Streptomyces sp. NPDC012389]|uniref:hypothetical protein n=1 Tax=unclassified Streptomyces TaxID=2593676 RepID=UPI00081D541E|nr:MULTISPECIES: hypothetical protein [unclassified Streptomyces]MYR96975.1 hypothetical protein [Streptomyces sp. SID4937]MYX16591.1 hypothetical protein [Streptomyces sp. SID8374]SCE18955.1 hypothetical protein GA0115243_108179 [Streptomyces sp. ScaeMP-e83]